MKFISLFFATWSMLFAVAYAQEPMVVMSYNIRFDNPGDGENAWLKRKDFLINQIMFHEADLVGVQEALVNQLKDMDKGLQGAYGRVGVGRDDGKEAGEFSAIFYSKARFKLVKSGTFWLSPTPDTPSKGWDAAIVRVCTWAELEDRKTKKRFAFFNTHFDHVGQEAREKSAQLIVQKIKEIAKDLPVVMTGDFNANPENPAYQTIAKALGDSKLKSVMPPFGPEGTFQAFDYNHPADNRIDYVFVSSHWKVWKYGVLSDAINKRFPSDHFPVLAKISLIFKS
jgi:endonuclease/exonuclease/phosphatase family metal-dependent hydrolase